MRKDSLRAVALLIIALFFVYRWLSLASGLHLGAALLFGALALAGWLTTGPARAALARRQALAANLGVSLIFLDLVFAQLEWREMLSALADANYWLLLPSFGLVVIGTILRTWRWQWLLRRVGRVSFGPAFRAACVGIGANMVLPARAGEFLRAYTLGRSTGHSKTAVFATLVVERILDGLTILLCLVGVILLGVRGQELRQIGLAGAAFYLLALGAMLLFYFRQEWFSRLIRRLLPTRWSTPVLRLFAAFTEGLHILRDGRQLLVVALQSLLVWIVLAWSFYPVMLAFDFGAPVPLFAPFLLVPIVALGLTIPAAPGGVGILQAAGVLAMQLSFRAAYGPQLPPGFAEQAAAFSLLMHLSQAVPEIALGAWAFLAEGLRWGQVETAAPGGRAESLEGA